MKPESKRRARNRAHWDVSLDPANLGAAQASADAFDRQVALFESADVRLALDHLEPLDGRWTLDLGGGLGLAAVLLARRGAHVVLCDLSRRRLAEARRQLERLGLADRVSFVQAEAERLPFAAASLDRAFTKSVLIHTNQPAAADELGRVLAPSGRAAFIEPLDANPFADAYRALLAPGEWRSITRYFSWAGLVAWARRAARSHARHQRVVPMFLLGFLATAFQFLLPHAGLFRVVESALIVIDRGLFRLLPGVFVPRCWMGVVLIRPRQRRMRRPVGLSPTEI